jgi:GNAT superfamily N-acetyltransferase
VTASTTTTTKITAQQIRESGAVLARAFYDDPLLGWVIPDDETRLGKLEWLQTAGVKLGHSHGEVYTTAGRVEGNAVWLPPGQTKVSLLRMVSVGLLAAPLRLGPSPFMRFMRVMNVFDGLHERDMQGPHWYLMILGVDPPRQGQGVGGSLIQPVLARADEAGLPCYLETQKTINVPFYQRHGFDVVIEDDIPGGGPHYWTMKRLPRAR